MVHSFKEPSVQHSYTSKHYETIYHYIIQKLLYMSVRTQKTVINVSLKEEETELRLTGQVGRFQIEKAARYNTSQRLPQVAQRVKNLPAMREMWIQSLGWEDALEKEMATHSSILAWRIPWTEESGEL